MDLILRIFHNLTQVYPLHPMLVHFPIALTGAALLFILLALWRCSKILEQVAFANLSLTAISTIPAALFGIRDNLLSFEGNAPNHTTKIILACILLVITTATVVIRWKKKTIFQNKTTRTIYMAAYFLSFVLAAVLGFLGGVITYGF
jgi:uncharacterized membrane protein